MDKNSLIAILGGIFLVIVLGSAGIYSSYKVSRAAVEHGLEECQIDMGTYSTMWVKDCSEHIKISTAMEKLLD